MQLSEDRMLCGRRRKTLLVKNGLLDLELVTDINISQNERLRIFGKHKHVCNATKKRRNEDSRQVAVKDL